MVTAAALLWAAIGAAFLHAAIDGSTIAGWGQVLIGIAAVIAAMAGLFNGRRIKAVEGKADVAAGKAGVAAEHAADAAKDSATAVRTLGPENGKTLQQLLHETHNAVVRIEGFEEYQHDRNHKIINAISELGLSQHVIVAVCERLLDKLNEEQENP